MLKYNIVEKASLLLGFSRKDNMGITKKDVQGCTDSINASIGGIYGKRGSKIACIPCIRGELGVFQIVEFTVTKQKNSYLKELNTGYLFEGNLAECYRVLKYIENKVKKEK